MKLRRPAFFGQGKIPNPPKQPPSLSLLPPINKIIVTKGNLLLT